MSLACACASPSGAVTERIAAGCGSLEQALHRAAEKSTISRAPRRRFMLTSIGLFIETNHLTSRSKTVPARLKVYESAVATDGRIVREQRRMAPSGAS